MMRLVAIAIIWVGCAVAWIILGSNLVWRTKEVTGPIGKEVHALWGPPGHQAPPSAVYYVPESDQEKVTTKSEDESAVEKVVERTKLAPRPVTLDRSKVDVGFEIEHRRKGLLWFPTYAVDFSADYIFQNPTDEAQDVTLSFPDLPAPTRRQPHVALASGNALGSAGEARPRGREMLNARTRVSSADMPTAIPRTQISPRRMRYNSTSTGCVDRVT